MQGTWAGLPHTHIQTGCAIANLKTPHPPQPSIGLGKGKSGNTVKENIILGTTRKQTHKQINSTSRGLLHKSRIKTSGINDSAELNEAKTCASRLNWLHKDQARMSRHGFIKPGETNPG